MAAITQDEQKTKVTAAFLTMIVGGIVFLALLFRLGGDLPGPPGDEMGMEVNLGYDNVGYGDTQPDAPVGNDSPQPQEQASSPAPPPQEAASSPAETQPVEPEAVATSDAESPVEINEKKKDVKPVEKTPEKPKEKPKEKPAPEPPKEVVKEVKKEPVKEVKKDPAPDNNAIFKPGSTTSKTGGDATGKEGKPGNEGDDPGTVGDKGNPNGSPDAKGSYTGKPGGGNGGSGPALELNGWEWDDVPKPSISNNETGRIVFEIEVDDNGELIGYRKISGGLSASAQRACEAAIQKLTFTKKPGAKVPAISKGKITFVVRSE